MIKKSPIDPQMLKKIKKVKFCQQNENRHNYHEKSHEGIIILDNNGIITSCNDSFIKMIGYPESSIIGTQFTQLEFLSEKDIPEFRKFFSLLSKSNYQQPLEVTFIHKNGTPRVIEIISHSIENGGELSGFLFLIFDITGINILQGTSDPFYTDMLHLIKKFERKLIERIEFLENANQFKSELLQTISHEFRSSINVISGLTEMLLLEIDGHLNVKQREDLQIIKESIHDLLKLGNDILDLRTLEAGELVFNMEVLEVQEILSNILHFYEKIVQERGLKIELDLQRKLPPITVDRNRMKEIFRNLIDNAIRYTKKGEIGIGAHAEKNEIIFWVRDTGMGIDKKDQERIFNKFVQIQQNSITNSLGEGLGLYIVKRLIELQGGRIWIESKKGKGSTFFFSIPVAIS